MKANDDDAYVMKPSPAFPRDDRLLESLVSGRPLAGYDDLAVILRDVRALVPNAVPTPNAALAAMLADGFTPAPSVIVRGGRPERRRLRSAAIVTGVVATMMGGLVGAAAANVLPDTLQRAVARAVEAVSPLHLPRPETPTKSPTGIETPRGAQGTPSGLPSGTTVSPHKPSGPAPTPSPTDGQGPVNTARPVHTAGQQAPGDRGTESPDSGTSEGGQTADSISGDTANDPIRSTLSTLSTRRSADPSMDTSTSTDDPTSSDVTTAPTPVPTDGTSGGETDNAGTVVGVDTSVSAAVVSAGAVVVPEVDQTG